MKAKIPSRRSQSATKRIARSSGRSKISSKRSKSLIRRFQISSKRALLLFVLTGFVFSLALLLYFIPNKSSQSSSAPLMEKVIVSPKQGQANPGLPVRLKIPKIKVDAVIDSVGLTRQGAVGVPKGPYTVAWFNPWPRPGEIGNAIITGHYGPWADGRKSVFDNISKLRKGDKLSIKDDKGATINFVVREIKKYDLKSDASEVFISTDGNAHLNLITCVGTWNKKTRLYSDRLVVFTDKE